MLSLSVHGNVPFILILLFISSFDDTLFFSVSSAYRTPSGKTHRGLYFSRRKQM